MTLRVDILAALASLCADRDAEPPGYTTAARVAALIGPAAELDAIERALQEMVYVGDVAHSYTVGENITSVDLWAPTTRGLFELWRS